MHHHQSVKKKQKKNCTNSSQRRISSSVMTRRKASKRANPKAACGEEGPKKKALVEPESFCGFPGSRFQRAIIRVATAVRVGPVSPCLKSFSRFVRFSCCFDSVFFRTHSKVTKIFLCGCCFFFFCLVVGAWFVAYRVVR